MKKLSLLASTSKNSPVALTKLPSASVVAGVPIKSCSWDITPSLSTPLSVRASITAYSPVAGTTLPSASVVAVGIYRLTRH